MATADDPSSDDPEQATERSSSRAGNVRSVTNGESVIATSDQSGVIASVLVPEDATDDDVAAVVDAARDCAQDAANGDANPVDVSGGER